MSSLCTSVLRLPPALNVSCTVSELVVLVSRARAPVRLRILGLPLCMSRSRCEVCVAVAEELAKRQPRAIRRPGLEESCGRRAINASVLLTSDLPRHEDVSERRACRRRRSRSRKAAALTNCIYPLHVYIRPSRVSTSHCRGHAVGAAALDSGESRRMLTRIARRGRPSSLRAFFHMLRQKFLGPRLLEHVLVRVILQSWWLCYSGRAWRDGRGRLLGVVGWR